MNNSSLIKMYEKYKKAATKRKEWDVVEYYSQVLVNIKRRCLSKKKIEKS